MTLAHDVNKLKQLWNRHHYTQMLYGLLPQGFIWRGRKWIVGDDIQDVYEGDIDWQDTHDAVDEIQDVISNGSADGDLLMRILHCFAIEFERFEKEAWKILNETDPGIATDLLADWERVLGLPETCFQNLSMSVEERQNQAHTKLFKSSQTTTEQWYVDFAESLGFTIQVEEIPVETEPAICGLAICGVARCGGRSGYSIMRIYILDGDSDSALLICALTKEKQAHVIIDWVDFTDLSMTMRMNIVGTGAEKNLRLRGTSGQTVIFNPGDGSDVQTLTLQPTDVDVYHTYAIGNYEAGLYGDINDITYLRFRYTYASSVYGLLPQNASNFDLYRNRLLELNGFNDLTSGISVTLEGGYYTNLEGIENAPWQYLSVANSLVSDVSQLSGLTNLLQLTANSCLNIRTVTGLTTLSNLTNVTFADSELPMSVVDVIFNNLDTANVSSCTISVDGENSPVSSASATSRSNLTGRSCTINFVSATDVIAVVGDSLSTDPAVSGVSWPEKMNNTTWNNAFIKNTAVGGMQTNEMQEEYTDDTYLFADAPAGYNAYLFLMGGINDIIQGVGSSEIISNLDSIITTAHGLGVTVVAFHILPASGLSSGQQTIRNEVNAYLTAEGDIDHLVDVPTTLLDPSDQTRYTGGLHLTDLGAQELADDTETEMGW